MDIYSLPTYQTSKEKRRKILISVISAHLALIIIPLIILTVIDFFKDDKITAVKVNLVSPQETIQIPQSSQMNKNNISEPIKESFLDPIIPKKKKEKKRKTEKPEKNQPKKIKKKTKKNRKQTENKQKSPENNWTRLKPVMKNNDSKRKASPQNTQAAAEAEKQYFSVVSKYIYRIWRQPGKTELRNRRPEVLVSVSVNSEGKILKSFIKKKSGISAMDDSAKVLFSNIKKLPRPPNGPMQFDIILQTR